MNQVSVRNVIVAASVLLLAFTPVCSAYAGIVGPAAAAAEPAPARASIPAVVQMIIRVIFVAPCAKGRVGAACAGA